MNQVSKLADQVIGAFGKQANFGIAERLIVDYTLDPSEEKQSDLSDWGINIFRDEAAKAGFDNAARRAIVVEESKRVRGLTSDMRGLMAYVDMKRVGSLYPLNRKMRIGLFCHFVAKGVTKDTRLGSTERKAWIARDYPKVEVALNQIRRAVERSGQGWHQVSLDSTKMATVEVTYKGGYGTLNLEWHVNPDLFSDDEDDSSGL